MFPNLTIITAFYDIGRSKWTGFIGGHPLPSYLKRTTDQYFECFERMLKLDNDIVVFTSPDLVERFDKYKVQKPNLAVIPYEFHNAHPDIREKIAKIHNDPKFYGPIRQPFNPEYWNVDYVMINLMKSEFVNYAIDTSIVLTELVAWLDFGYCRTDDCVPTTKWNYNFELDRIHLFSVKKFVPTHMNLREIINTNDVFIQGCHIVASKKDWQFLENEMQISLDMFLEKGWIDDDQTFYFMNYCRNPDSYEIHYLDPNHKCGWFQIFQEFNDA